MTKIVMEHQEEFLTLPADSILNVKVEGCEVKEVPGRKGTWQKLEITFKVLGVQVVGDGSDPADYASLIGSKLWGGVGLRLTDSPENKLRQWVEALLGMQIDIGFELDTDYLVGREARAITNTYERKMLDTKTQRPLLGHGIESLLPKANGSALGTWGQGIQPTAQQPGTQQPGTQPVAEQQTQQPVAAGGGFSGWGASGTDDPPF